MMPLKHTFSHRFIFYTPSDIMIGGRAIPNRFFKWENVNLCFLTRVYIWYWCYMKNTTHYKPMLQTKSFSRDIKTVSLLENMFKLASYFVTPAALLVQICTLSDKSSTFLAHQGEYLYHNGDVCTSRAVFYLKVQICIFKVTKLHLKVLPCVT